MQSIRPLLPLKHTLPFAYTTRCLFHSTRYSRLEEQERRPKEYELRVGFAIATLQDDIPHFFQKGLSEHSIYSTDIVLSDPHYTKLSIHGRTAYLGIAQMLKWSTSMYFDDILLEITKMRVLPDDVKIDDDYDDYDDVSSSSSVVPYSSIHQAEQDIRARGIVKRLEVRWKLQGTKNATFFQPEPRIRNIEGVFIYKFDQQGYIGEHRIQRIVPPPSRRVLLLHSLGVRLRSLFWENTKRPVLNPGF
ncbi:hypothetical protein FB192DRAFT_1322523 [Mucor lusitanicus]|uniref:Uncharacterized protein n=2 Tax=Mucor circinelloides f. lusitanicus TaxID=29924 RepID=A0A163A0E1_MUCCL|nr:hypothetical protein FB192DRAFT_1322523 [Mucor lusitanicus]OAD08937.1 hypothetical protein MUCCIDRAFT_76191 [Mucor lusitanicus CBS 277.49]